MMKVLEPVPLSVPDHVREEAISILRLFMGAYDKEKESVPAVSVLIAVAEIYQRLAADFERREMVDAGISLELWDLVRAQILKKTNLEHFA